jgi:hypothetical protein
VAALSAVKVPVQVTWFKGDHDAQAQHPAELAQLLVDACRSGILSGAS